MTAPVFGIFDHVEKTSGSTVQEVFARRLEMAEIAEAAGFHSYHLAEHHATPLGMAPAPSLVIAAMAARTRRLRLGPLVYLLPLYNPLRLIEEVCMLDNLTGGRFDLGVGRGISPFELQYYRLPFYLSREMFEEAFEVLLCGLRSERLNFRGQYYRYDDVPMTLRPLQQPHPPLWYGNSTENATRFAARHGMNAISRTPTARARQLMELYRQEYRQSASGGGSTIGPWIGATRHIFVADSQEQALAAARPAYRAHYNNIEKLWQDFNTAVGGFTPELDVARENGLAIVGSPEHVVEAIEQYFIESGCNYLAGSFAWGDLKPAEYMHSLELFAAKILPNFQRN
jgi:alkanesulfonate monooxygenase SsuD/methylene tetrahydromethanopterin reductase-like flavin-dependent oxidoreductase (luciferase family)